MPDEEEREGGVCPTCGGELNELGTLGRRKHFRCRNCGMESSRDVRVTIDPNEAPEITFLRRLADKYGYRLVKKKERI